MRKPGECAPFCQAVLAPYIPSLPMSSDCLCLLFFGSTDEQLLIMMLEQALAGYLINAYTFLPALSLAYAYSFAQDNPTRQVSFFIVNFDAKYLPFALLFMTFIIDGGDAALAQLTGLLAAHLYDFLTRIWPTFGGGKNYIFTPQIVKRWFGATAGSMQNRGYGFAVQGRGRSTADTQAQSSGRSTGTSNPWSGLGPGRRLGSE